MITMPMSTPRPTRPAVTRKSEFPPAAGGAEALAAADGLATATADRVGDGATLAGAAVDGAAVRDALAVPVGVAEAGAAVGSGEAPADRAGDGVVALVPRTRRRANRSRPARRRTPSAPG